MVVVYLHWAKIDNFLHFLMFLEIYEKTDRFRAQGCCKLANINSTIAVILSEPKFESLRPSEAEIRFSAFHTWRNHGFSDFSPAKFIMAVPMSYSPTFNKYIPEENCSGARNAYTTTMQYTGVLEYIYIYFNILYTQFNILNFYNRNIYYKSIMARNYFVHNMIDSKI